MNKPIKQILIEQLLITESNHIETLNDLITNARKFTEEGFIEEYVYYYGITTDKVWYQINKGDKVNLVIEDKDNKGTSKHEIYKTVVADKDYGEVWGFIMDNTKELQDEARIIWKQNKDNPKPKFKKTDKTIMAYHVSPYKFDQFKWGVNKTSGQFGASAGYFFFLDKEATKYYTQVIKDNYGTAYQYIVKLKINNPIRFNGQDIGTGQGRHAELVTADNEGYDSVIITNADTGYGFTDEIVVFDDDNIKVNKIYQI